MLRPPGVLAQFGASRLDGRRDHLGDLVEALFHLDSGMDRSLERSPREPCHVDDDVRLLEIGKQLDAEERQESHSREE